MPDKQPRKPLPEPLWAKIPRRIFSERWLAFPDARRVFVYLCCKAAVFPRLQDGMRLGADTLLTSSARIAADTGLPVERTRRALRLLRRRGDIACARCGSGSAIRVGRKGAPFFKLPSDFADTEAFADPALCDLVCWTQCKKDDADPRVAFSLRALSSFLDVPGKPLSNAIKKASEMGIFRVEKNEKKAVLIQASSSTYSGLIESSSSPHPGLIESSSRPHQTIFLNCCKLEDWTLIRSEVIAPFDDFETLKSVNAVRSATPDCAANCSPAAKTPKSHLLYIDKKKERKKERKTLTPLTPLRGERAREEAAVKNLDFERRRSVQAGEEASPRHSQSPSPSGSRHPAAETDGVCKSSPRLGQEALPAETHGAPHPSIAPVPSGAGLTGASEPSPSAKDALPAQTHGASGESLQAIPCGVEPTGASETSPSAKETLPAQTHGAFKSGRTTFTPPTAEEAQAYLVELGAPASEAPRFVDYHQSKGWMVGRTPMSDWRAAARNWARRWKDGASENRANPRANESTEEERPVSGTEINWDNLKDCYNSLLDENRSLAPRVTEMPTQRKNLVWDLMRNLLKNGVETPEAAKSRINKAMTIMARDPFYGGRGQTSWCPDFDWLFKPTNFNKILEREHGKYSIYSDEYWYYWEPPVYRKKEERPIA